MTPEEALNEEEALVAELELLGIRYLSRTTGYRAASARPADRLLADLVRQPSARVREAAIAVLLACPQFAEAVPAALARLALADATALRCFYTAAVLLGREHAAEMQALTGGKPLADLFSAELGLPPDGPPHELLILLGRVQHWWALDPGSGRFGLV